MVTRSPEFYHGHLAQTTTSNVCIYSFHLFYATHCISATGTEDIESCENRNGAASALLHIDESDGVDDINRQRNKTRRRSEPRQVQTGENGSKVSELESFLC